VPKKGGLIRLDEKFGAEDKALGKVCSIVQNFLKPCVFLFTVPVAWSPGHLLRRVSNLDEKSEHVRLFKLLQSLEENTTFCIQLSIWCGRFVYELFGF
jgi:hypothetical protein